MWLLYQLVFGLGLVVGSPFLLLTRGSHYLATVRGRLGGSREPRLEASLWVHAVSVGEVAVARALFEGLESPLPVVVTTVTPTGQARARADLASRASIAYLPFELGFAIRRFLTRFSPRALILIEGEYWPLVLHRLRRRGAPIAVVNGRVSDRSFRRMRKIKPLLKPLLAPVERFGVQTESDRERLLELGARPERVVTTGNLKFESPEPTLSPELEALVRGAAAGRPIFIAGSTMRGEETLVLDAFRRAGAGRRALLVLAPRHPERWDDVGDELGRSDLLWARRSTVGSETPSSAPLDVLLLDTLGELAGAYRLADGAFIGGTLVPTGGHNPIEAARFGVPVVVGPSMENFREIAAFFDSARAWRRADGPEELAAVWSEWLEAPEGAAAIGRAGGALVASHRGALKRTLELLAPMLEGLR